MTNVQKTYSRVLGGILALVGIIGLFIGEGELFGIFGVNIAHSIIHLASGAALIAFAGRKINYAFGAIYGAVTIFGLVAPALAMSLLHIDGADNILHILITVPTLLVAYLVKEE